MRYLAALEAKKELDIMVKNSEKDVEANSWPSELHIPSFADICQIFVGKSTYYDNWKQAFPGITKYPKMVAWLQSDENCDSDLDVWGRELSTYHFKELLNWLKNGQTLGKKVKKGESPTKVQKGKDKGKEKEL